MTEFLMTLSFFIFAMVIGCGILYAVFKIFQLLYEVDQSRKQYKQKYKNFTVTQDDIIHKLVNDDYSVNHFQHYRFTFEHGFITYGIAELFMYFGDDIFQRVERMKNKKDTTVFYLFN